MDPLVEAAALGLAAPAAIAAALFLVLRRLLPDDAGARYAAAIAFAAAYIAAFALLPLDAELVPSRHWHWIPYLAGAAAILGPVAAARGVTILERALLYLLASLVAAWFLVPDWASLQPPRTVWVPGLAVGVTLIALLVQPLFSRVPAARLLALLALSALVVAALIAGLLSLKYGQAAAIAAAAFAGCAIAAWLSPRSAISGAVALAFAWVVGGWAFIGCIEPQQPLYPLLLAPAAPLALWCCAIGPAARLRGYGAAALQAGAVALVLAVSAGLAAFVTS